MRKPHPAAPGAAQSTPQSAPRCCLARPLGPGTLEELLRIGRFSTNIRSPPIRIRQMIWLKPPFLFHLSVFRIVVFLFFNSNVLFPAIFFTKITGVPRAPFGGGTRSPPTPRAGARALQRIFWRALSFVFPTRQQGTNG